MRVQFIILSLIIAFQLFARQSTVTPGSMIANRFKTIDTNRQLSEIGGALEQMDEKFEHALLSAAREEYLSHKVQSQLKAHLTPQELVPLFLQKIDSERDEVRMQHALSQAAQNPVASQPGGIAGRVTISGAPPEQDVTVYAFDSHGYFAGSSEVSLETGDYAISGLRSDSFYVMTRSGEYADQIYKNVPAHLGSREAWRQAEKVFVPLATINGIDFDLMPGAKISGTITAADGTPVEDFTTVEFIVTTDKSPLIIDTRSAEMSGGAYEIVLPATGRFKVQAAVDGYEPTWHVDQQGWTDATIIEINDLNSPTVVNFKVKRSSVAQSTGAVSGTIFPAFLAISAAFSAVDTSFVQLGLSLGLPNEYEIQGLPPGNYFIYADDYLGTLIGAGNYRGEFWDGAAGTPYVKKAKPVAVAAGSTTADINFLLDEGASIKGTIVDHNNSILDSLTLVLLNADVLDSDGEPFLAELELHVVSTEFNGAFEIPGLRAGTYLLRTVSDIFINFDIFNTDSILVDGKHKGKVVDQFFGGEANLFRILDVEPILLQGEEEVFTADFKLTEPHFIAGHVLDAETNAPVTDVLIAALEDTSGYPFYPLGEIDSLGNYTIGPLPMGHYKVVALTGLSGENDYLTEYRDDQRSFYAANVINLDKSLVPDVHFMLERGATIQGYVDLAGDSRLRAGADTLAGLPVVAYDSETGAVASFDYVQFNGGYRINRLLPGTYKVAAIPQPSGFATTYLGGGATFDATQNKILALAFGDVTADQIIALDRAAGTITGTVTDSATGLPISSVFVGAYDQTGHLVGYALTDYDARTGLQISSTGSYAIKGLAAGTYFIRTVSLFTALPLVDDAMSFVSLFENFDLLGFLFGGSLTGLNLDLTIYKDLWHAQQKASVPVSLDELVFQVSAYGLPNGEEYALLPVYLPLPFHQVVPTTVTAVTLPQGGSAAVNFILAQGKLGDIVTDVDDNVKSPVEFTVQQNYPNPFNASTTISFLLPDHRYVELSIFDLLGRRVRQLIERSLQAGPHTLRWDGRDDQGQIVSTGIYIAKVTAGDVEKTMKMVLVK
ncbi:T9SS type A sorting domain-containing protein [candidate division KSB1 bacterium]|nr:T9SS type A sorting domain-containing protein [candidate division KSB1 bacterium]RQW10716.1 MAG: T9SS C-terminal target domain-containing protein [candidate division KSB1 bacterium]